jgi:DNA repair photolyase
MNPIYKPTGRAGEYGEYALNIYLTCPHRCTYCYAPKTLHLKPEQYFTFGGPRPRLIDALKAQIEREGITGKLIHIPFLGDAYPKGQDSSITREVIKILKTTGNHVQILTKNGKDAQRDFDLLDSEDWFGVSWAGYDTTEWFDPPASEPGAGAPIERLAALDRAHSLGIKTWISIEPVLRATSVYFIISDCNYIDNFKIGKLNYFPSDIDWKEFGYQAERLCKLCGRHYYIKTDLRKEMEKC